MSGHYRVQVGAADTGELRRSAERAMQPTSGVHRMGEAHAVPTGDDKTAAAATRDGGAGPRSP